MSWFKSLKYVVRSG